MADVCPTVDEAVMVAGLCRALAWTGIEQHRNGVPLDPPRPSCCRPLAGVHRGSDSTGSLSMSTRGNRSRLAS